MTAYFTDQMGEEFRKALSEAFENESGSESKESDSKSVGESHKREKKKKTTPSQKLQRNVKQSRSHGKRNNSKDRR